MKDFVANDLKSLKQQHKSLALRMCFIIILSIFITFIKTKATKIYVKFNKK